jgi:hypothetical protein
VIKREFRDMLGRVVKVDDILVYCSPFDGLHALLVTMEDPDGLLYVSPLKSDRLDEGEEWLQAFDEPRIYWDRMEKAIRHIKVGRRCFPIELYKDYIVLKDVDEETKIVGISRLAKIC